MTDREKDKLMEKAAKQFLTEDAGILVGALMLHGVSEDAAIKIIGDLYGMGYVMGYVAAKEEN